MHQGFLFIILCVCAGEGGHGGSGAHAVCDATFLLQWCIIEWLCLKFITIVTTI